MIWQNPSALLALAVVAAPILIHLLIQRRAERLPFPTLRFLQPTRLAAIRRHLLEDLPLVVIRVAVLASAVAALAGPLLTDARRQTWDRRIVRAIVANGGASARTADNRALFQEKTFDASTLGDGIRRAMFWLESAPPGRRELVVVSPFPIGSITDADVAAIPASVGVRFERKGTLPVTRTVPVGRLLTAGSVLSREVTLAGDRTSVHDAPVAESMAWPIEVVAAPGERAAIDAAISAVRSQRVWIGPGDRRAGLVLIGPGRDVAQPLKAAVTGVGEGWMADAVARVAGDGDLQAAASRVPSGVSGATLTSAPWQLIGSAADGRPLIAAAGSANGLIVASAAPASEVVTPVLLRAMANAIATPPDLRDAEVLPITDAVLQRWSRPAPPVSSPRTDTVDQDDRRWLWLVALLLLVLEMWIRRSRAADEPRVVREENARVA